MLGRFSMHYPSFRNSVLFWVMIVLLLSFLIFFPSFFFFKLRILVVTSSCFWTRGNKMVWLICFKVFFFIILLHDWNPRTEMASVICDINLLVTRKLVFQKIMWCYFGWFFFKWYYLMWFIYTPTSLFCVALHAKNFRILFNVVYWIGLLFTLFW